MLLQEGLISCKKTEIYWYYQLNGHEPKSYETIGSVDGHFFIIYLLKHVKDRINTLNIKNVF